MKPTLPKGMRDFLPQDVAKRKYVIDTISEIFVKFGFQPIETPVMEKLDTLSGKYGDDSKLIFKVLNVGDFLKKADRSLSASELTPQISGKGLRYDLTVPLARYVVQNQNDISFPFKRYQIAPVWRADRPQRGRYREFYQCDVDVIGSDSLLNEVELMKIYSEVFSKLNLDVTIRYSNRKLLFGMMQVIGLKDREIEGIKLLDKLDKIGIDKVIDGLRNLGLNNNQLSIFNDIIKNKDTYYLDISSNELIEQGKKELEFINKFKIPNAKFDATLARGLDYYTGCIFEVVSNEYSIGSIGGGGRYDNLTEMFGKKELTGVGISFGLDRICDTLEYLNKFPSNLVDVTKLLFVTLNDENTSYAYNSLCKLRNIIKSEMYFDGGKIGKK